MWPLCECECGCALSEWDHHLSFSVLTSQPYTPYSYTLGSMLRELHWCLLLAATTETNALTLTQILKVRLLHLEVWFVVGGCGGVMGGCGGVMGGCGGDGRMWR